MPPLKLIRVAIRVARGHLGRLGKLGQPGLPATPFQFSNGLRTTGGVVDRRRRLHVCLASSVNMV